MLYELRELVADELFNSVEQLGFGTSRQEILESISVAKIEFAELCSNICFRISKQAKKNPKELAEQIIDRLQNSKEIFEVSFANGFINFRLNEKGLAKIIEEKAGLSVPGKRIVIEFPSVNPNKPWHIGHLRNALIGQAITNLLRAVGNRVMVIDYIDDLGLQFAQTVYGLEEKGIVGKLGQLAEKEHADFILGNVYVEIAARLKEDSQEVRETVRKMEHSKEYLETTRKIAELCVKAQYYTAGKFGIERDLLVFESDVITFMLEKGLERLRQNKIIELINDPEDKLNGCYVIDVSEFRESKDEKKVLLRSDGTLTYSGKDLIFHMWKYGVLEDCMKYSRFFGKETMTCFYGGTKKQMDYTHEPAEKGIVVIGNEQAFPQKVIALGLTKMGFGIEHKHVGYAHVRLPEGRFSGRKGTWIGFTAEELYEEGVQRAGDRINEKKQGWEKVAELVGTSATKYFMLKHGPTTEILFEWDKALALEGNSAPYILYTCVRVKSILGKAEIEANHGNKTIPQEFNEHEKKLLQLLARHSLVMDGAATSLSVNTLTDYLFELAVAFNSFYSHCQILNDEKNKGKRIAIIKRYLEVMELVLGILGIDIPEWM